jgi:hypothetical protein
MNTAELDLLKKASEEIKGLRKQNMLQGARLSMFDDMMLVLRVRAPEYGMTSCPDIVSQIDNFVAKAEEESK